jgi:hypothetical protein
MYPQYKKSGWHEAIARSAVVAASAVRQRAEVKGEN